MAMNDNRAIEEYEKIVRKNRFRKWIYHRLYPLRCIRYGHQRIHRGFCDMDVWDIDQWFCRVIPPMLDQFRKTTDTIPHSIEERFTDADGKLDEEAAVIEWDRTIRKMIWLFREADKQLSNGGKLKDGEDYMEKCKAQAFSLFCKCFHDLWV